MRRAPIVITATVVGLICVLEFHTRTAPVSLGTAAAPAAPAPASAGPARTSRGRATSGASPRPGSSTRPAAGTRTVTGPAVNYSWGVLSVSVTASGSRIVKVGIASLDDGGNPRSQFIDQQAIPMLEQQALQAQSAGIQGVSGASYTSAGFIQSLQGALHQLGLS